MVTRPTLKGRALALGLHGVVANWDELRDMENLEHFIEVEEQERQRRGLARRYRNARLGRFKPMPDFDWDHPEAIDRALVDDVFTLRFIAEIMNIVIVGANGLGKTMIGKNIGDTAVREGHTVKWLTASELLADLDAQESSSSLKRRVKHYLRPAVLIIDEVGYLSYDNRAADLFFEVVNARYQKKPTIITTNRPFSEWNEVFPNASCVVTLIDRLIHNAEIVNIQGESYRLKEANEKTAERRAQRKKTPKSKS